MIRRMTAAALLAALAVAGVATSGGNVDHSAGRLKSAPVVTAGRL